MGFGEIVVTGMELFGGDFGSAVDRAAAVSFDIFDTLFLRPLADPEDVFDLLGERFGIPDFRQRRRAAQQLAFVRMAQAGRREITLDDIYACLRGIPDGVHVESIYAAELEIELELTQPNPRLVGLFLEMVRAKRVVLTTDMYLPGAFFSDLLDRHGLPHVPVFVSCECNATKRDRGELFDVVASTLGEAPERLVHIGDNLVSDVERARARGLRAFHYQDPVRVSALPADRRIAPAESIAAALPRLVLPSASRQQLFELGLRYGGPAAHGFLKWLRRRAAADCIDKLLFVSRDGYLLEQMAARGDVGELVAHDYLYGSRVAFALAGISAATFGDSLDFLLSGAGELQPREMLERIGVQPPAEWVMCDIGLGSEIRLDERTLPRMAGLLHAYRSEILKVCWRNRRGLYLMLRKLGVEPGMRVGLVDIGWRGSTQEAFIRAVSDMLPLTVVGYYLGLAETSDTARRRSLMTMRAMLTPDTIGGASLRSLYAKRTLVELMFSATHPAVIGYQPRDGEAVEPVFDSGRGTGASPSEAVRTLLSGALEFGAGFDRVCRRVGVAADPLEVLAPFLAFMEQVDVHNLPWLDSIVNFDAWSSSRNTAVALAEYS